MKMVKSLLLGTAAGLIAVAGAQAADLPVKAKPVEYVKVCSLYGAGFYYMPGTDICIKIGGYVRAQYYSWGGTSGTVNAYTGGALNNRTSGQDFTFRVRTLISTDTRQQTEYGTLRTYMNIGWTHDTGGPAGIYVNRAFIQLAGFTFGKAQSFFDLLGTASVSYFAWPASDTGDGGVNLAAYTAQFGNGFSGTIAIEDATAHRTVVINEGLAVTYPIDGAPTNSYGNFAMPNFVANLRVDQAWGTAQIMGAVNQVRGLYYGTFEGTGHPSDEYGWVVGAGLALNAGFISPGDRFQVQASYTEGALRYMASTQFGSSYARFDGTSLGYGYASDGVYGGAGSSIELTKAWQISATYDHVWNQRWKTSLYGGIVDVQYNDTANALMCASFAVVSGTCDQDWSTWWVGSRTQFNINASTYMGVDILYTSLNTASSGAVYALGANGSKPAGNYSIADQDNLAVTFRIHRDFLP